MEAMEMKEIEAAVEGILFASGEPVAADRIAVALDLDRDTGWPDNSSSRACAGADYRN